MNNNHKYYTQLISQINVTNSAFAYFVVWTTKETLVLKVSQDSEHWARVSNNLSVFFKVYVCLALLGVKELTYCGKCGKVLLEECEIMSNE